MKVIWKLLIILSLIILFQITLKTQIGSKVIYRDNFVIIQGTIQMPEAGSETINGGTKVNYPQGYTSENCVVVSLMSHNTLHSDHWCTTGQVDALSVMQGNGNLFARLTPENITILVEKFSTGEQRRDVTFKLVLMKLPEISETEYTLGDVNGDGQITMEDYELVSSYDVGSVALTDKQLKAADVNKDGQVNTGDTFLLLKYVNGVINSFE